MKGKIKFSINEKNRIIQLLDEKVNASRSEQKRIRQEIRSLGFYITDFDYTFKGFTSVDFRTLINNKRITITET